MKKIVLPLLAIVIFSSKVFSQDSAQAKLAVSGYVDAYYAYYTDSMGPAAFSKFASISPRNNSFGVNIAQVTLAYDNSKVRGITTLQAGDISNSLGIPGYNLIQEANVGVKLFGKIWADAGIFKTHIGAEAMLPKDNLTSSMAIGTWHEPAIQAGLRLSYEVNAKFNLALHVLNGYNMIADNNSRKDLGVFLNYKPTSKLSIVYANIIGDEMSDTNAVSHLRVYNNLVVTFTPSDKTTMLLGADFCSQQNSDIKTGANSASMFSALLSVKHYFKPKFALAVRAEVFQDPDGFLSGVLMNTDTVLTGLKLMGFTLSAEYKPTANAYLRLDNRILMTDSKQEIFYADGKFSTQRFETMLTLGVTF